jgi:hypothetical protein
MWEFQAMLLELLASAVALEGDLALLIGKPHHNLV